MLWAQDGFRPPGFTEARSAHLAGITDHFWFAARERLLMSRLTAIAARPPAVLELGCGTGELLPHLATLTDRLVAVEGQPQAAQQAAQQGSGATVLHADVCAVPLEDGWFDAVLAFDVLEHVDPAALLGEAHRLTRPGGVLLLTVPASQRLWSDADVVAGHRTRYDLPMLSAEVEAAGWSLEGHTHYQFLLYPLMLASRALARGGPLAVERRPPGWVGRALGRVNELEVRALGTRSLPWGSSLVAWARRP